MHFPFVIKQPRHAIRKRGCFRIAFDCFQILEKLSIAVGNHMHSLASCPVTWSVNNAASVLHPHRAQIIIEILYGEGVPQVQVPARHVSDDPDRCPLRRDERDSQ